MTETLKESTVKNVSYNMVAKVVGYAVQAISSIILTQILAPSDYGIYTFALIIVGFCTQFNDLGINTALIRQSHITDQELYTAFTIKLGLSFILSAILIGGAPIAVYYFHNKEVVNVVRLLTLSLFMNVFIFIPNIILTRELNYKIISRVSIACSIIVASLTVLMAIKGFKYWSLVFSTIATALFNLVVMNYLRPRRIKIFYDPKIAENIFSFGMSLFFSGLIVYIIFNFDNLVVGSLRGAESLGYYGLAFNWGALISTVIESVIISVMVPTFSKFQHDIVKVKESFLKLMGYVSLFAVIVNVALFVCSRDFIFFVLGNGTDKWLPALNTFRIFCLYGIIRSIMVTVCPVFISLGNSRVFLMSNLILALIQFVLIYPVIKLYGIIGLAILVTVAYGIQFFVYYPRLKREINVSANDFVISLVYVILAGVVAVLLGMLLNSLLPFTLAWMFGKVLISVCIIVVLHGILTHWKPFREIYYYMTTLFGGKGKGAVNFDSL